MGFLGKLDSGELLTGSPTVAEVTTSDLTLDNEVVNSATLSIDGVSHTAGQAIQFNVAGGTAGTTYTIKITAGSDGSPAQTFITNVTLVVTSDS